MIQPNLVSNTMFRIVCNIKRFRTHPSMENFLEKDDSSLDTSLPMVGYFIEGQIF